MKVEIVKPYGYCLGVSSAIKLAKKVKEENSNKYVVILGMLVHNIDALNELNKCGIKSIYEKDKTYEELLDKVSKDDVVILTAHGHDKKIEKYLIDKSIKFYDATCPFVNLSHQKILEAINNNKEVIYIGKRNHPEAIAALSISNNVHLYDINSKFDYSLIKTSDPLIINQTTFSSREINDIVSTIKSNIKDATSVDSVCNASTLRQKALLNLSNEVELIYVIGGKNSNNTKTLFNLAKDNFKNAKVINIENKNDINKNDLINISSVALVSGASTPIHITDEIRDFLITIK